MRESRIENRVEIVNLPLSSTVQGSWDQSQKSFYDILLTIWHGEVMPADLRDVIIVSLYKNKGSKSEYGGISLLSIDGKICYHLKHQNDMEGHKFVHVVILRLL